MILVLPAVPVDPHLLVESCELAIFLLIENVLPELTVVWHLAGRRWELLTTHGVDIRLGLPLRVALGRIQEHFAKVNVEPFLGGEFLARFLGVDGASKRCIIDLVDSLTILGDSEEEKMIRCQLYSVVLHVLDVDREKNLALVLGPLHTSWPLDRKVVLLSLCRHRHRRLF